MRKSSMSGPPKRVSQDGATARRSSRERQQGGKSSLGHGGSSQASRFSNIGASRPSTSSGRASTNAGNRFSLAPKSKGLVPSSSRMSGIGVRGRSDVPKDPRPISDKSYVKKSIRRLLEFLVTKNYPGATSEKLLAAPSSKEFFKIFEFIYSQLTPGYKMVNEKMEEEVVKLLKMLAYPFTISKMHLFSVGTPHVWPNLCAALLWMIDLNEASLHVVENFGIDAIMFHSYDTDDMNEVPEEKYWFDFCEKTYTAFMEGKDTFDEEDEELEIQLKMKYRGGNIENIIEENDKLEQDIQILEQKEESLLKLQEQNNATRQDLLPFENYITELSRYKRSLEAKVKSVDDDCALLQTEVQSVKNQLERVTELYDNQAMTPADVERMKEEQEQLKRQIKQLESQEESIDNDIFKSSIETAKISEMAASEVAAYNRLAADLKLIPSSAENANGQDYSLMNRHNSNIPQAFEQEIKPKLIQMKKHCMMEVRQNNKKKYQQTFQLEQLQENINDTRDNLKKKREELSCLEADVDALKQRSQQENKSNSTEKSRFEDFRTEYESQIKEAQDLKVAAEMDFVAAQKELESKKAESERKMKELEKEKGKVHQEVEKHKLTLRAQLTVYVEHLRSVDRQMDTRLEDAERENKRRSQWMAEKRQQLATLQQGK